jgi:hypothetical protein
MPLCYRRPAETLGFPCVSFARTVQTVDFVSRFCRSDVEAVSMKCRDDVEAM